MMTDSNNENTPTEAPVKLPNSVANHQELAKIKEQLRKSLEPEPSAEEVERMFIGVTPSIRSIPYARKLSSTDYAANKTATNQWHLVATASKNQPFVMTTADGTSESLVNQYIDQMYDGEGVDLICADIGDGFAIPNHPEWMSTKYPGVNRYVKFDWSSVSPYEEITFTPSSCENTTNAESGRINFPPDFASKLQFESMAGSWGELYGRKVRVVSGPGAGQSRRMAAPSKGVCVVNAWDVVHAGSTQTAASDTITLASSASSVNNAYRDYTIRIDSGTGAGQSRLITDYNGTSKVATLASSWSTLPSSGATYHIANVPTSNSTLIIDKFTMDMSTYYDVYTGGGHGTGTMGLAGGKTYGYAREAALYAIGSHGATELVRGKIGSFSFSGSAITTANAAVSSRLSYLSSGDFIEVLGATPTGNNGRFTVQSNTLVGSTRTITVVPRPSASQSTTFATGTSTDTTIIKHDRCLWGIEQILDIVAGFHRSKTNGRPTVLCMNVNQVTALSADAVANSKICVVNGEYVNIDTTDPNNLSQLSDLYNLPFRTVGASKSFSYHSLATDAAFDRAAAAGVLIVAAAGNESHRIVPPLDPTFNDHLIYSTSAYSTGNSISAATENTVTIPNAPWHAVDDVIRVTSGPGAGQHRYVTHFDDATKTATVAPNWTVQPANGDTCDIHVAYKHYYNRGWTSSTTNVTTVGAVQQAFTNNLETRASYSVVGPRVDVFAPAEPAITAAVDLSTRPFWNGTPATDLMPHPDNSNFVVGGFSGTSAANPIVSGIAACIAQARPWIDSGGVRSAIHSIATRDRLYDSPNFSDLGSLGGAENRFIWYPFQHISSDQ